MAKSRKGKRSPKRNMDPNNTFNYRLVCSACGAEYEIAEKIDLAEGHWQSDHAEDGTAPEFTIVWVGIGPPPKRK